MEPGGFGISLDRNAGLGEKARLARSKGRAFLLAVQTGRASVRAKAAEAD
jgi:hypothetical protein